MATTSKAKTGAAVTRRTPARKAATRTTVAKSMARKPVALTKTPVKTVRKPNMTAKAVVALTRKPAAPAKVKKAAVPKKVKLVRDSFSFPAHEHALLGEMKKRALKLGREFKKSEILRAGISHLANMADTALVSVLAKVERVKTGRPSKKSKKR